MSWKLTNTWLQKTFKKDAVRVSNALNQVHIDNTLEYLIPRDGEYNRDGKPKFYSIDVLVHDPTFELVGIDMWGKGSASEDNPKRDAKIKAEGICLLHFKNSTKSESIINLLESEFRKP